jgi:F-type H+-transporting ATPase subunit b
VLIDWFTVGAQILNFLILIWLLKHFLYKPVLTAIDGREQRIQREAKAAADKQLEAQAQLDDFRKKNQAFNEQRAGMISEAILQANSQREQLLGQARKDAEELLAQYADTIRNDQARMGRRIKRLVSDEVFGIARKALADLASAKLEERMAEQFVLRMRALNAEAKKVLSAAVANSSEPIQLRSTFDLQAQDRAAIQNALNETLGAEVPLRVVTAPDGICGIELRANGQLLAWSIADYLDTLQRKAFATLDSKIAPPPGTPTAVGIAASAAVAAPVPVPSA